MHDNEKIKIDYIAKIEGHASFLADIVKGEIQKARIEVEEGARLIEGILINRKIEELPAIASRICGICPTVHYLTSLKAIESALGVKISEQTLLLRKLMMTGQIMTSHGLHLFFFSCPDFLGFESGLELIKKCPVEASYSIKLRDISNKITEIIGGRAVHPLTPTVGGFRKLPKRKDLENLKAACLKLLPEVKKLAQFFLKLDYPEFERKTDYICLTDNKEYAVHNGKIEGLNTKDFLGKIKEIQIPGSVVKRTFYNDEVDMSGRARHRDSYFRSEARKQGSEEQSDEGSYVRAKRENKVLPSAARHGSYMVGALPRIKNNNQYLNPLAKKIFLESEIQNHYFNPFYNILAQAIEIVHFLEEAIKLLDNILEAGIKEEKPEFQVKSGRGIVAMEAPRGLLFYDVQVAKDGTVSDLNIITPTVQNLANLEKDLEDFENLKGWKKLNKEQKKQKIAMLIRAYDPCITCATH